MQSTLNLKVNPGEEDLEEVLVWLKAETLSNGNGFYNNKNIIEDAFLRKEALVLKIGSESIGLAILTRDTVLVDLNIFVIKPTYRDQGFGTVFYNMISTYLDENGYFVIKLFCAPATSEQFWRKIGLTKLPNGVPYAHELTYYDILLDTAFSSNIRGLDKIELWDIDYYPDLKTTRQKSIC